MIKVQALGYVNEVEQPGPIIEYHPAKYSWSRGVFWAVHVPWPTVRPAVKICCAVTPAYQSLLFGSAELLFQ